jgi:hypothetical protein
MRTYASALIAFVFCFVLFLTSTAVAQTSAYMPEAPSIGYILENTEVYDGRQATLPDPVWVVRVSSDDGPTRQFQVRDQEGDVITVYTNLDVPQVNDAIQTAGVVEISDGELFLFEQQRGGTNLWLWVLVGALAVAFVGTLAYALTGSGGTEKETVPVPSPVPSPDPRVDYDKEDPNGGETVSIPTEPKTQKLLGTLKMLSDHGKTDRPLMVNVSSNGAASGAGSEFTIGRGKGCDIRLKPQTVSRNQAKLVYANGQFYITNYVSAQKNPTMVDGYEMAKGKQMPLDDGAEIQMGEVRMQLQMPKQTASRQA